MSRDAAVAVALRRMQWRCDETAFRAGAGRLTRDDAHELADELAELADAIRRYANTTTVDAGHLVRPEIEYDHQSP